MTRTIETASYEVLCRSCDCVVFLRHVRMVPTRQGALVADQDDLRRAMLIHLRYGCGQ